MYTETHVIQYLSLHHVLAQFLLLLSNKVLISLPIAMCIYHYTRWQGVTGQLGALHHHLELGTPECIHYWDIEQ